MSERVVLAYSGGLDTSVAIKWLAENYGMEVIALAVDIGMEKDYHSILPVRTQARVQRLDQSE